MSYFGPLPEDPERTVVHDLYHSGITPTLPRFVKRPEADRRSSIFFQLVVWQDYCKLDSQQMPEYCAAFLIPYVQIRIDQRALGSNLLSERLRLANVIR